MGLGKKKQKNKASELGAKARCCPTWRLGPRGSSTLVMGEPTSRNTQACPPLASVHTSQKSLHHFRGFFGLGFFFFPPLVAIALLGFFLTIQRTCLRSSSPVHGKALWPPGRKQARLAESPRPAGLRRPVLTPRAGVPAPVPPLSARLRSSGPRELPQSSHLGLALGSGDKSNKRGHVS